MEWIFYSLYNNHNRLITRAPDWTFQPQLAYDWDVNEEMTEYTFYLEEGVKFHDGTPMTSADVKHSFYAAYGYGSGVSGDLQTAGLQRITTPDDYTVVFEFAHPAHLDRFAAAFTGDAFIKPKHLYEAPGIDWETLHSWSLEEQAAYEDHSHTQNNFTLGGGPVGTGPFQMVEYVEESFYRFERFEDYWEDGLPYLDELIFVFIPDTEVAVQALLNGEVDAFSASPLWAFPMEKIGLVNGMNDFTVEMLTPSYGTYRLTFNMNPASSPTDPLLDDTDGDGLVDGLEVNIHGTDPQSTDSDEDGLNDFDEVEVGTDPYIRDTDGDWFRDGLDPFLTVNNFYFILPIVGFMMVIGIVQFQCKRRLRLIVETPVLLLILTEGGTTIFSKKFELGEQMDEQLIGGLLRRSIPLGKTCLPAQRPIRSRTRTSQ